MIKPLLAMGKGWNTKMRQSNKTVVKLAFILGFCLSLPSNAARETDSPERKQKQGFFDFEKNGKGLCLEVLKVLMEGPVPEKVRQIVEFEFVSGYQQAPGRHARARDLAEASRAKQVSNQTLKESVLASQKIDEPFQFVEWPTGPIRPDPIKILSGRFITGVETKSDSSYNFQIGSRILTGKVVEVRGVRNTPGFPDGEPHDYVITLQRPFWDSIFEKPAVEEIRLSHLSALHVLAESGARTATEDPILKISNSLNSPDNPFEKFYLAHQFFEHEQKSQPDGSGLTQRFQSTLKVLKEKNVWKSVPMNSGPFRDVYEIGEQSVRDYFLNTYVAGTWSTLKTQGRLKGFYINQIFVGKVIEVKSLGMDPITNSNFVLVIETASGVKEIRFGENYTNRPKNLHVHKQSSY